MSRFRRWFILRENWITAITFVSLVGAVTALVLGIRWESSFLKNLSTIIALLTLFQTVFAWSITDWDRREVHIRRVR